MARIEALYEDFKKWLDGERSFDDLDAMLQKAIDELVAEEETLLKGDPTVEDVHQGQANTPKLKRRKAPNSETTMDLIHKANGEQKFTLGPWYIPDKEDAHSEWTDAEELQKALWDYVRSGDRNIRLQHNTDIVAGEWVEAMSFPVPITLGMTKASGDAKQVTYPAGTVFLGVKWNDWAWDLVKQDKITGFSIGGSAARVEMGIPMSEVGKSARKEANRFVKESGKPAVDEYAMLKSVLANHIAGNPVEFAKADAMHRPVVKYKGVTYTVKPLTKAYPSGVFNVAGMYGDDDSVAIVRTDGERFWAVGSGSIPKLDYAKAQHVLAEVSKMARQTFGGNRSAAGQYAANVRWGRRAESVEGQQAAARAGIKAAGRGPFAEPTTPEGQAVGAAYASMETHVDFDALAADMKAAGIDPLGMGAEAPYDMLRKHMSPERIALHDKIVADHFINPDGSPKTPPTGDAEYVFMGGGPASGKSSMLKAGNGPEWAGDGTNGKSGTDKHSVAVNADEIKGQLPPYPQLLGKEGVRGGVGVGGRVGQMAAASVVHEESSILSKAVNARAIEGGFNVILDGTGDASAKGMTGKINAVRSAKGANGRPYKVTAVYATVPTRVALERASNRGLPVGKPYKVGDYESKGEGRFVAPSIVAGTHRSVSRVFPEIHGLFDSVKLVNTDKKPPTLIASGTKGGKLKIADAKDYDAFLGKGNEQ